MLKLSFVCVLVFFIMFVYPFISRTIQSLRTKFVKLPNTNAEKKIVNKALSKAEKG